MSSSDDPRTRGAPSQTQTAELSFLADPDLVMLARMVAAATGSRAGFNIEQVEDLRLAVNELCLSVIGTQAGQGRLEVCFAWGEDVVEVTAFRHGQMMEPSGLAAGSTSMEERLSTRILDTLVDEYELEHGPGTPHAWLRVRRRAGAV